MLSYVIVSLSNYEEWRNISKLSSLFDRLRVTCLTFYEFVKEEISEETVQVIFQGLSP